MLFQTMITEKVQHLCKFTYINLHTLEKGQLWANKMTGLAYLPNMTHKLMQLFTA